MLLVLIWTLADKYRPLQIPYLISSTLIMLLQSLTNETWQPVDYHAIFPGKWKRYGKVVIKCTMRCNTYKFYILHTHCIYIFPVNE
jgi:hypothetical protein